MSVTVIGLGYVGLSLSVLLARKFQVYAVDIDSRKVEMLKRLESPILDEDITYHLSNIDLGLVPSSDMELSLRKSKFAVVATPTDYDPATNQFDVSSVKAVIQEALLVNPNINVIIKSTIPIGLVDELRKELGSKRIYFSPEFLREGSALRDNLNPSRIIIGGDDEICREFTEMLVSSSERGDCPVIFTGTREAEAIKLFSNTYLAMRVAYFNELDSFCLSENLNASQIITGVSLEPRIGQGYNNPSFGYGGYCFPKDTKQMVANYGNIPQELMSAVVSSNETRFDFLADQILSRAPTCVGLHRLSMKAGSDNYRQSAIFGIVERLQRANIDIIFYEPNCDQEVLFEMRRVEELQRLKQEADLIIANRMSADLEDVTEKVFTRDIFNVD